MNTETGLGELLNVEDKGTGRILVDLEDHLKIIDHYLNKPGEIKFNYGDRIRDSLETLRRMGFSREQVISAVKYDYAKKSFNRYDPTKGSSTTAYVIVCVANMMENTLAAVDQGNEQLV